MTIFFLKKITELNKIKVYTFINLYYQKIILSSFKLLFIFSNWYYLDLIFKNTKKTKINAFDLLYEQRSIKSNKTDIFNSL